MLVYYISHPDVVKDPTIPVPRWPLSERGRARMTALLARPWVAEISAVYCSCLLYTSDAADERSSVDLGGRRIIKKKNDKKKKERINTMNTHGKSLYKNSIYQRTRKMYDVSR